MAFGAQVVSRGANEVDVVDELSSGTRHVARFYDEVECRGARLRCELDRSDQNLMTVSDPDPALQGRYDEMTTPRSIVRHRRVYGVNSTTSSDIGGASAHPQPLS